MWRQCWATPDDTQEGCFLALYSEVTPDNALCGIGREQNWGHTHAREEP